MTVRNAQNVDLGGARHKDESRLVPTQPRTESNLPTNVLRQTHLPTCSSPAIFMWLSSLVSELVDTR